MIDIRTLARILGGSVSGRNTVTCPGPGHSRADRSLSVTIDPEAPANFIVHSFAHDDWKACRDYVAARLGIDGRARPVTAPSQTPRAPADRSALSLWSAARDFRGTLAERYLQSRGFSDLDWISDLRFHPQCPFGPRTTLPCMVALYRDILTNEPKAIHRTALTADGRKIDRKALGPKAGCAIKLSEDAEVGAKLTIGEGIETAIAGAALLYRPVWALGDAGEIARLPVLDGIESLTILVDHDEAGRKAAAECSTRWTAAGREVFRVVPTRDGADMADVAREVAA